MPRRSPAGRGRGRAAVRNREPKASATFARLIPSHNAIIETGFTPILSLAPNFRVETAAEVERMIDRETDIPKRDVIVREIESNDLPNNVCTAVWCAAGQTDGDLFAEIAQDAGLHVDTVAIKGAKLALDVSELQEADFTIGFHRERSDVKTLLPDWSEVGTPRHDLLVDEIVLKAAAEAGYGVASTTLSTDALIDFAPRPAEGRTSAVFDPTQGGTLDVQTEEFGARADLYLVDVGLF